MQIASLGLLGSIDRYDPEREVAFMSFAVPTIMGELKRHFRDTGWVTAVPRTVPQIAEFLELEVEQVLIGLEASPAHYAKLRDIGRR